MRLVIENAQLWTNGAEKVLQPACCIHIEDGIITYAGPQRAPEKTPDRIIDAQDNLIMPGCFDAHSHVAMNLLRGYADGLPLQEWLFDRILPAEEQFTDEMVYWASLAAMCELVRGGTTGFNDMYDHHGAIARAAEKSGMRAVLARGISTIGATEAQVAGKLREAEELYLEWNGKGRIRVLFSPHAQYTNTSGSIRAAVDLAQKYHTGIHTHLSETWAEHEQCIRETGKTPAAYFASLGAMDVPFIAAHCVYMTDDDMDIFREHGACVAACVRSNLKLGSGIAPLHKMRSRSVKVALGTDGAASNDRLSMFSEMDTASLLQKGTEKDSSVFPPSEMLEFACTVCCGELDIRSGRLEAGWNADLIIVDRHTIRWNPHWNDLSSLLYSAMDTCVLTTICGGDILYENGAVTFCDEEEVMERLELLRDQIR